MSACQRRLATMATLSALVLLAVSGCGGGNRTPASTKASTSPPSSSTGQTYATKAFKVPLTVTVDPYLGSPPTIDSPNLLSWDASISTEKVRFLVPVKLYRPDSATPEAPPKDYLKYLRGLAKHGVEFSNVSKVSVDGHPGSLMTATSDIDKIPAGSLNGTLGCATPAATKTTEGGCFGVVPDLLLRIAVVKVGGTTLVAWARTRKDEPNEAFFAVFDRMLRSVRFR
jgi:hypothetical protein